MEPFKSASAPAGLLLRVRWVCWFEVASVAVLSLGGTGQVRRSFFLSVRDPQKGRSR